MKKMNELLNSKGKLVGLLFAHEFDFKGPPFGGNKEQYQLLFKNYFDFVSRCQSFLKQNIL